MKKNKPELITNEYTPSNALVKWCKQMGINSETIKRERLEFIFWHKEKRRRRSNFNLAFKNWLKNTIKLNKKQEDTIKKGSLSFKEYKPIDKTIGKTSIGRNALKKLKDMI